MNTILFVGIENLTEDTTTSGLKKEEVIQLPATTTETSLNNEQAPNTDESDIKLNKVISKDVNQNMENEHDNILFDMIEEKQDFLNEIENKISGLVQIEAEKTKNYLTQVLQQNSNLPKSSNTYDLFKNGESHPKTEIIQPRQYQPNFGGNQLNIENLHITTTGVKMHHKTDNDLEMDTAINEFYLFLKNKKSENQLSENVELLNKLVESFDISQNFSKFQNFGKHINSPMLIKLLKYEL